MSESVIMLGISILGALSTLMATVWTVRGMLGGFDVKLAVMQTQMLASADSLDELKENDRQHAERTRRHSEKLAKHEVAIAELRGGTGSHPNLRTAR